MLQKISNPIILLIFVLLSAVFVISLRSNNETIISSTQNLQILKNSVLKQENDVNNIKDKLSDSRGSLAQEKILREELLLQKEGEFVFKIPELPEITPSPTPTIVPKSPWQQWQEVLF